MPTAQNAALPFSYVARRSTQARIPTFSPDCIYKQILLSRQSFPAKQYFRSVVLPRRSTSPSVTEAVTVICIRAAQHRAAIRRENVHFAYFGAHLASALFSLDDRCVIGLACRNSTGFSVVGVSRSTTCKHTGLVVYDLHFLISRTTTKPWRTIAPRHRDSLLRLVELVVLDSRHVCVLQHTHSLSSMRCIWDRPVRLSVLHGLPFPPYAT